MQKKYQLIQEIIELVEAYEEEGSQTEASVMGFSVWLNQRLGYFSVSHMYTGQENNPHYDSDQRSQSETMLTMLISYLYRYAKHYTKKALENTQVGTLEEFGFLVTLLERDSLTKTELINLHLLELTSGIEIIKRLVKQGLLDSFPDPDDKRSRRVRITDAGRGVLFQAMQNMQKVSHIVSGDLSENEQQAILPILSRLNDFHAVIHKHDRKSELGEIVEKYVSPSDN